jgi:hypothetical protein
LIIQFDIELYRVSFHCLAYSMDIEGKLFIPMQGGNIDGNAASDLQVI